MRREVTARVISSASATKIQCTNGGGSPPGLISCAVEGEGDGGIVPLARNRPRNSPLFTKAAPTAVSPVCSAATGRRPRHPGPATAFLVRRRRPTLALSFRADGAGCDESSASRSESPGNLPAGHP
ncbi:hypothetical protein SVAN01_03150 [Stagonosporopsis vannaccii]|nr:hypothetical protein SVAN01_03150 [Stagonosporopsis vannaccii]